MPSHHIISDRPIILCEIERFVYFVLKIQALAIQAQNDVIPSAVAKFTVSPLVIEGADT